jgi:hypothetical protein
MRKVHVTQDEYGFWFISLEEPDGSMKVVAHHYVTARPAIDDAQELIHEETRRAAASLSAAGGPPSPRFVMVVDSPRRALMASAVSGPIDYKIPAPRRAGE